MTPRLKPLPQLDDLLAAEQTLASHTPDDAKESGLAALEEPANRYMAIAEAVTRASHVMNELLERNKKIHAEAEAAISTVKGEARSHRERASKIEAQLDTVKAERQRILHDGERRIRTLTEETDALKDRLEKAAAELLHSEQWLEYLNTRIKSQLDDVFTRTEEFWAGRRTEPSS
jgi:DNA repair ATPase RecN